MNEGAGAVLHDVSGRGRDIDLTGAGYSGASWTNGRYSITTTTGSYRYAFNGKEKDQDIGEDDYDYGARIYDARLGRWNSIDFFTKSYPSTSPFAFVLNNPLTKSDLNGDVVVEADKSASKKEQKQQVKALKAYAKGVHDYIANLQGNELEQILSHSGYDQNGGQAALLAAWDNTDPNSAIKLRFSKQADDQQHESAGLGSNYIHPDGNGSLTGVNAKYEGNVITLASMFKGFYDFLSTEKGYVNMPDGGGKFDYKSDQAKAMLYVSRLLGHEMVHKGRELFNLSTELPDSRNLPSDFERRTGTGGAPNMYEAGQHWEYSAFQHRIRHTDLEYGLAVNVYFRHQAGGSCTLNVGNSVLNFDAIRKQITQSINSYLDHNFKNILQRGNKTNKGSVNFENGYYTH